MKGYKPIGKIWGIFDAMVFINHPDDLEVIQLIFGHVKVIVWR